MRRSVSTNYSRYQTDNLIVETRKFFRSNQYGNVGFWLNLDLRANAVKGGNAGTYALVCATSAQPERRETCRWRNDRYQTYSVEKLRNLKYEIFRLKRVI